MHLTMAPPTDRDMQQQYVSGMIIINDLLCPVFTGEMDRMFFFYFCILLYDNKIHNIALLGLAGAVFNKVGNTNNHSIQFSYLKILLSKKHFHDN